MDDQGVATSEELLRLAEERGKIYGFLSSIYIKIPSLDFVTRVLDEEISSSLFAGALETALSSEMKEGLEDIQKFIKASQGQAVEEVHQNLSVDWTRLFRGIKPDYSPLPPYESLYRSEEQVMMGPVTMEVKKKYAEAGVGLASDHREPPDYIGLELDFMRFLAEKEAEAREKGKQKAALVYLEKQYDFLGNHLIKWIPAFCDKVIEMAKTDFYLGIAKITKDILVEDQEKIEGLIDTVGEP